jgi:hypothetical protein
MRPPLVGRLTERAGPGRVAASLGELGFEPVERAANLLQPLGDRAVGGRGELLAAAPSLLLALGVVDLLQLGAAHGLVSNGTRSACVRPTTGLRSRPTSP